jgi:hypothetical protein
MHIRATTAWKKNSPFVTATTDSIIPRSGIQRIMKQPAVNNNINKLQVCLNKKHIEIDLPNAKSTMPPPTATADPLEHPPGTRSEAAGFVGVPKCLFSPWILNKEGALSQQTH